MSGAGALTVEDLDDLRIAGIKPLIPSACLIEDLPGEAAVYEAIQQARRSLAKAVRGEDQRLVVVCGPVSAHDPEAVKEYAVKLHALSLRLRGELLVVMRVFLDEPAGGAGYWSGAMYDPGMDGSFRINKGFRQARQLLLDINKMGLPVGCIYLDSISPQFIADLVSWSFVSSRLTQSALHRNLASGLSTPVGFQAAGSGAEAATAAIDAVHSSSAPHAFLSVSKQGVAGLVETVGNPHCHVVLPDGDGLDAACSQLTELELPARAMLECTTADAVKAAAQRVGGGDKHLFGVLVPSFLSGGCQPLRPGDTQRKYGVSVTEACMDWASTESALDGLAAAVRARRHASPAHLSPLSSGGSLRGGSHFLEVKLVDTTDNLRVRTIRPLVPAAVSIEEMSAELAVKQLVLSTRCEVSAILHGKGVERLLVVVGPDCIHDTRAAMEYASRLQALAAEYADALLVVMRANFERASTTGYSASWPGFINDPELDGSHQINGGFRQARKLLLEINRLGLPCGCEYLDTITPQFVADLISWAMVGPRTCASRAHRELASGLSTPVGFHRGAGNDERVAIDAVRASSAAHAFLSVSKQGVAGIVETVGNCDCHILLSSEGARERLQTDCSALESLELPAKAMVDCGSSTDASGRLRERSQAEMLNAVSEVAGLVKEGSDSVLGVLLPSSLLTGRQQLRDGKAAAYGMSVTEPCVDWGSTAAALKELAEAVRSRRAGNGNGKKARLG